MDRPILDLTIDRMEFFKTTVPEIIHQIKGNELPEWGIMTPHHVIEHLVMPLNFVLKTLELPCYTPEEKIPKLLLFLRSEYGLARHVAFPLLPKDSLPPLVTKSLEEAKIFLLEKVESFVQLVSSDSFEITMHPIFGPLDKEDWLLFQYKHFMHHFMQFGWKK